MVASHTRSIVVTVTAALGRPVLRLSSIARRDDREALPHVSGAGERELPVSRAGGGAPGGAAVDGDLDARRRSPAPGSSAVPVTVTVDPAGTVPPLTGEVMIAVGGPVSVRGDGRHEVRTAAWRAAPPMSANRLTVACWTFAILAWTVSQPARGCRRGPTTTGPCRPRRRGRQTVPGTGSGGAARR